MFVILVVKMGLQPMETVTHPRREKHRLMSPVRNMEASTMYREFKMAEETNHVKTEMQTIVKMSCDPNNMAYSSSESKSMKEDRILDSLDRDFGQEKGDLSKDDVCSLSSEWLLRLKDLYRKSPQTKTEESVLGTEEKSLDIFPFSKKCVEKFDDNKENTRAENMKQPNLEENEKNKIDSNKSASRKNDSAVYMYKLEKEKFIEYYDKGIQEVQGTSVKNNKLKENMKIRDRKQRQEEENMKMKQNLMSKIVDSENERFGSKTAKNKINEKQKKDETNTALVADKTLVISDHSIDQQNKNFHDEQQDVEKREEMKKVDADGDLKLPVEKSAEPHMIQTSIDESRRGQTYLPTLLRDVIVHISQDEKITQGQLVQKGLTDFGIKTRDVTESKQTENETADIHCTGKQEKGRKKFKTFLNCRLTFDRQLIHCLIVGSA